MSNYVHESLSGTVQIRDVHDGGGYVTIAIKQGGEASSLLLPPGERQAAAQALAGPSYRVVPPRDSDDGWIAVQRSEYERLLDRDEYPRVQGTCPSCGVGPLFLGEEGLITCSWVDCKEPDAAANLLAGSAKQPVDPASVRVGDYVEVVQQHDDIPLRITVEGEVYQLGRDGDSRHLFYIRGYGGPAIGDVTSVRILRREPEPDEAAVEALYEALRDVYPRAVWDLREAANTLARRNVRVVSE